MNVIEMEFDLVVIGGGTGGPMAAVKAKERDPKLRVLLIDKANVKRSGAISMGMDGLNNAVFPGHATPEQYVKEITVANDGIVNQKTVMAYARNSYAMIEELDRWGVRFEKDETGDYAMRKVHHMGTYVLPMPEGHDIKKVLYRRLKRTRVEITNRLVATRLDQLSIATRVRNAAVGEERLRVATETGRIGIWDWDLTRERIIWIGDVYRTWGLDQGAPEPPAATFARVAGPRRRHTGQRSAGPLPRPGGRRRRAAAPRVARAVAPRLRGRLAGAAVSRGASLWRDGAVVVVLDDATPARLLHSLRLDDGLLA